jgi:hypothetical protein
MADSSGTTYPERSELIAETCHLLKLARRPLLDDRKRDDLDREGWAHLIKLSGRLSRHLSFEHIGREELRQALRDAVRRYKAPADGKRPNAKEFASELLDGWAQDPIRATFYLGIQHLKLPHETTVRGVRFLQLSHYDVLAERFRSLRLSVPELACEVCVIGGTEDLLLQRARKAADGALGLLRQQFLFGFQARIYLEQVMFGLDGTYTWRTSDDADLIRGGWWRQPQPMLTDLTQGDLSHWFATLSALSDDCSEVPAEFRDRVDTCVGWLDVAGRTDSWQIIIPAIFSAMEAILVPETSSALKAAVVTVRSVAVHVALGESFFDPGKIIQGYSLRSDLVHGTPTLDVPDEQAADFALSRRRWAFGILRDYLRLARTHSAGSVQELVRQLDAGHCVQVCTWLEEHGGSAIVEEYRRTLRFDTHPCDAGGV